MEERKKIQAQIIKEVMKTVTKEAITVMTKKQLFKNNLAKAQLIIQIPYQLATQLYTIGGTRKGFRRERIIPRDKKRCMVISTNVSSNDDNVSDVQE